MRWRDPPGALTKLKVCEEIAEMIKNKECKKPLDAECVYNKITHRIVTGLASTLLLMLLSFGLLFFMIALLGEVVTILFEEVKNRPLSLIAERESHKMEGLES